MPFLSIAEIAKLAGANRETVRKRKDQLGLKAGKGSTPNKQLFESRDLLMLIPDPGDDNSGRKIEVSLTEARTREALAKAEKTELENETSRGERIPREDVEDVAEEVFAMIRERIDGSSLLPDEKELIFEDMRKIAKDLG